MSAIGIEILTVRGYDHLLSLACGLH